MSDPPATGVPFDQDYVEPPQPSHPSPAVWVGDGGGYGSLDVGVDSPAAGVVHDVIAGMPRATTPSDPPTVAGLPATGPRAEAPPMATPDPRPAPSPSARSPRKAARDRSRLARRTIRHVDAWSVLKLALVFYTCLFAVFLVAGVVLWGIAAATGVIGNIEHFLGSLVGDKHFHFLALRILEGTVLAGLVLVALAAAFTVLAAVFFNLIADLVGGVDVTVVDHEPARQPPV